MEPRGGVDAAEGLRLGEPGTCVQLERLVGREPLSWFSVNEQKFANWRRGELCIRGKMIFKVKKSSQEQGSSLTHCGVICAERSVL